MKILFFLTVPAMALLAACAGIVPIKQGDIAGTYVARNTETCGPNTPSGPDTLRLMADGNYTSGFYGAGTYELNIEGDVAAISWMAGNARMTSQVVREINGNPKIVLFDDTDCHYARIGD